MGCLALVAVRRNHPIHQPNRSVYAVLDKNRTSTSRQKMANQPKAITSALGWEIAVSNLRLEVVNDTVLPTIADALDGLSPCQWRGAEVEVSATDDVSNRHVDVVSDRIGRLILEDIQNVPSIVSEHDRSV